jgi:predicted transcriptional regulator of viral defense system
MRSSPTIRFKNFLSLNETVLRARDLQHLWKITNKNTLYTTLKRYTQKGLIHRIFKGLYTFVDPRKIAPELLASRMIGRYSYLSLESVLFNEGYISQMPQMLSFVSEINLTIRRKMAHGSLILKAKKLPDWFLYNESGIIKQNGYYLATAERAISDLLYFNAKAHFDRQPDWKKIRAIQKAIGYPPTPERYN